MSNHSFTAMEVNVDKVRRKKFTHVFVWLSCCEFWAIFLALRIFERSRRPSHSTAFYLIPTPSLTLWKSQSQQNAPDTSPLDSLRPNLYFKTYWNTGSCKCRIRHKKLLFRHRRSLLDRYLKSIILPKFNKANLFLSCFSTCNYS